MTYINRTDFVNDYGVTKTNVIETMKTFEKQGLDDRQIEVKLLEDKYVKSSRVLYDYIRLFKNLRDNIKWI